MSSNLDNLMSLTGRTYKPEELAKFSAVSPSQKADEARKADEKALKTWRAGVQKRDGKTCRRCARLVSSALTVAPERREVHHIAPRGDAAVRTDVRNGLQVCLGCHEQIERGQIHLVQKAALMFRVGSKSYINAGEKRPVKIQFVKKETA